MIELFSFEFWMWAIWCIILFASFFEIRAAVREREYHLVGGIILNIVIGSIAIYNTENCIFCLSQYQLSGSIYGATAITLCWCFVSWIYCRIKY